MTKLNVVNKKNEVAGVAIEMENGRFEIIEAGVAKEVAASTFKRWYKITGEVQEQETNQLEALLEGSEELEQDNVAVTEIPAQHADVQSIRILETRGGKCEKIVLTVLFNELSFVITEYDGYVCDVTLEDAKGNVVYKSTKMSIKDALEHLGYTGDDLKAARKVIMSLRKEAKQAI